jgi:hypothetical protein
MKRTYTTPALRIVALQQPMPLLAGSGGSGISDSDVIINIFDGDVTSPDVDGWNWSGDGIGDTSLDR